MLFTWTMMQWKLLAVSNNNCQFYCVETLLPLFPLKVSYILFGIPFFFFIFFQSCRVVQCREKNFRVLIYILLFLIYFRYDYCIALESGQMRSGHVSGLCCVKEAFVHWSVLKPPSSVHLFISKVIHTLTLPQGSNHVRSRQGSVCRDRED